MDWQTIAAIAGIGVGLVSAVTAIWARADASKSHKLALDVAESAKESAEHAATNARIAQELFDQGRVRLHLEQEPETSDIAYLVNAGTHDAHDVTWEAPAIGMHTEFEEGSRLRPGQRIPFHVVVPAFCETTRFVVRFRRAPDSEIEEQVFIVQVPNYRKILQRPD